MVEDRGQKTDQTSEKMAECFDDILELSDDDSDSLETLGQREDLEVESSLEQQLQRKGGLTKTEAELEAIWVRLASTLETAELEQRSMEALLGQTGLQTANLPAGLDLLKHDLIEEFETVCQNVKALIFLLCRQTKIYIKNL